MNKRSKLLLIVGCLLILVGVVLLVTMTREPKFGVFYGYQLLVSLFTIAIGEMLAIVGLLIEIIL